MWDKTYILTIAVALAMGSFISSGGVLAQADANWYVLKNKHGNNCYTQPLISKHGNIGKASWLRAGGPYETKAKAVKRLEELQNMAVCARD